MAVLLVGLSVTAVLLAVAMPTWKQMAQREKEEELVWRGQQYARAIGLFQRQYANAFPPSIDVLVREKFLRKKYKDPITNDDFVPLSQAAPAAPGSGSATASQPGQTPTAGSPGGPAGLSQGPPGAQPLGTTATGGMGTNIGPGATVGGIIGVASKSKAKSIRIYNGRTHYNEWAFVYTPQTGAPGIGGAPGPGGVPGATQPGPMGQPGPPGTRPGFGSPTGGPGGNPPSSPPRSDRQRPPR